MHNIIDNTIVIATHGGNFKTFCCFMSTELNVFVKATKKPSRDVVLIWFFSKILLLLMQMGY